VSIWMILRSAESDAVRIVTDLINPSQTCQQMRASRYVQRQSVVTMIGIFLYNVQQRFPEGQGRLNYIRRCYQHID
jgi:hypothetical protein